MTRNTAGGVWSEEDLQGIAAQGLTAAEVERQLSVFRRGVPPVRLNRTCRAGDGIVVLHETEQQNLLMVYEEALRTKRLMKFVPASGAASRMFRDWYQCIDAAGFADKVERTCFAENLKKYAFFYDLQAAVNARGRDIDALLANREETTLLRFILDKEGLNYGLLPKALLKFHAYPEGGRTAIEEHLVEAALYARDAGNVSRLHFTVSREHEAAVRSHLSHVTRDFELRLDTVFGVGISTQDPATDTVAVDPEKRPFRNEDGKLIFRPGGHGSILQNLNLLDEDVIFLKNIDNIVPDRFKPETVLWKKLLGGYMVRLQEKIFACVRLLAEGNVAGKELDKICDFVQKEVNICIPYDFRDFPLSERQSLLFGWLNRPIRVCGMVVNEGEPGGGPFWVDDPDGKGGASLQIIEESQINHADPKQRAVWSSATHFNPVDIVCGVRDYCGRKFDLMSFVDPATVVITRKSEKGRELLALERPGLWNGSMAFWNTVFIEVPLSTFNPVKTVDDLLRPQHL